MRGFAGPHANKRQRNAPGPYMILEIHSRVPPFPYAGLGGKKQKKTKKNIQSDFASAINIYTCTNQ